MSIELTETNQLKTAYNRMYAILSDYIWDYDVVEALVDVELETYKVFPDIESLRSKIRSLRMRVRQVADAESRIMDAIDTFSDAVDDIEEVYAKIVYPKEVSL